METVIYHAEVDCSQLFIYVNYLFMDSKGTVLKHKSLKLDYDRDYSEESNLKDIPGIILNDLTRESIKCNKPQIIKL